MNVDPFIDPHPNLTPAVLQGLGWLYLVLCGMTLWWTIRVYREDKHVMVPVPVSYTHLTLPTKA